jgi:dTDP-3-amino-2,3,6-trideoxy-4-keto-D-glucose/dTDP-3-amino-3,4,6-trideoxy-alpha-D-glucose/dTDP-2,6-dideoxy-D-kanosamine transaminase
MSKVINFLPVQYSETNTKKINHNYLTEQFSDRDLILEKIKKVVVKGDFTLGDAVNDFEKRFAQKVGAKEAIGVGSGTDALFLSLKALGIGYGDEVLVPTFTFYATIGAIVTSGATPVFVDSGNDFNINPSRLEASITEKTKAIVPVHWSGKPCDMDVIESVATKHNLFIVEDACHAITAEYKGRPSGTYGNLGCFSLHPLKNLNVWGDGGLIVTNDSDLADKIRLMRNHGLSGRDSCELFAYNSRLDTIQAVVADHLLDKIDDICEARIKNSLYLDEKLGAINGVSIPPRDFDTIRQVFHIYPLIFEKRDELKAFLELRGIDAKIHYPVPMHLQRAANKYGYKKGDFPVAEHLSSSTLSLPVHEFVTIEQLDLMIDAVRKFYS